MPRDRGERTKRRGNDGRTEKVRENGGLEGRDGDEKRSEESRREEENGKGQGRGDKSGTLCSEVKKRSFH